MFWPPPETLRASPKDWFCPAAVLPLKVQFVALNIPLAWRMAPPKACGSAAGGVVVEEAGFEDQLRCRGLNPAAVRDAAGVDGKRVADDAAAKGEGGGGDVDCPAAGSCMARPSRNVRSSMVTGPPVMKKMRRAWLPLIARTLSHRAVDDDFTGDGDL